MTTREFYVERRKAEFPTFLKVFKALPKDRLDYKPDERSPSAEQVTWTLVHQTMICVDVARDARGEWIESPAPDLDDMIEKFETASNELAETVSKMDEETWNRKAQFVYQGKVVSEQPVGQFLWSMMFDAIHHRGQLSAYLRPMGGKVPAIYGPSADEKSMPSAEAKSA
ncbi:MAG TPA: DinB family protein [Pyrinomonadaceae bacterium]|nr:DinB family protein [Pyrinomonadaceae bacterium]